MSSTYANISPSKLGTCAFCALIISGVFLLSGCQTLALQPEANAKMIPADAGMYQIQLDPAFGKTTVSKGVITENMTVQDALEQAGAGAKFRGMSISLSRLNKEHGGVLKLPIDYDFKTRSISPHQNYALHPGDSISVKAKSNGSIEKMSSAMTGGVL